MIRLIQFDIEYFWRAIQQGDIVRKQREMKVAWKAEKEDYRWVKKESEAS